MGNERQLAVDIIRNYCEENDLEFRDDYSGRGMYGKRCVGFVGYDYLDDLIEICDRIRDEGIASASEVLGIPRVDNMGMQTIVYFPNLGGAEDEE